MEITKKNIDVRLFFIITALTYTIISFVYFRMCLMYEWHMVIKLMLLPDAMFLGLIEGLHKRDNNSEFLY